MSFTDGKPRIATEEDTKRPWGGLQDGRNFRCGLCGHRFVVGNRWRWVFTNDSNLNGTAGNPFVCEACDGPREEVIRKLAELYKEFMGDKFWRFRQ